MAKGLGCLCWPAYIRSTYNDEEQFINQLAADLSSRPGPNTGSLYRPKSRDSSQVINNNNKNSNTLNYSDFALRRTNSSTVRHSTPESSSWETPPVGTRSFESFSTTLSRSSWTNRPPLFRSMKEKDRYPSLLEMIPPTPGCSRRSRAATLPSGFTASLKAGDGDSGRDYVWSGNNWKKSQRQQQQQNCSCSCCNDVMRNTIYKQPNGFSFVGSQRYYNARQEVEKPSNTSRKSQSFHYPSGSDQLYDVPMRLGSVLRKPYADMEKTDHSPESVPDKKAGNEAKVSGSLLKSNTQDVSDAKASYYSTPPKRYSVEAYPFADITDCPQYGQKADLKLNEVVPTQTNLIGHETANADGVYSQIRSNTQLEQQQHGSCAPVQIPTANGDLYKTARSYKVHEADYENTCRDDVEIISEDKSKATVRTDEPGIESLDESDIPTLEQVVPCSPSVEQIDLFYQRPRPGVHMQDNTREKVLYKADSKQSLARTPSLKIIVENEGVQSLSNEEKEIEKNDAIVADDDSSQMYVRKIPLAPGVVFKNESSKTGFTEIDLLFMSPPPQCHHMTLHPYMNSTLLKSSKSSNYRSSSRVTEAEDYLEVAEPRDYFSTVIPPNCHTLPRRSTSKNLRFEEYLNDSLKPDGMSQNAESSKDARKFEKKRSSSDSSDTVYTTIMGELRESCLIDNYKNRKQQKEVMRKQQQQQQHLFPSSHLNQLYVHFAKKRTASSSSSNVGHLPSLTENLVK